MRHGISLFESQVIFSSVQVSAVAKIYPVPPRGVNPMRPVHEFIWDSTKGCWFVEKVMTKQLAKHTENSMVLGV